MSSMIRRALLGICFFLLSLGQVSAVDMCTTGGPQSDSQVVYHEGFSPAWGVDAAWSSPGVTFNPVSGSISGRTGLFALQVTFPDPWKMLILERKEQSYEPTYGKKALVFRVRGVQNNSIYGQLWIRARDFNYEWLEQVPIARYMINADQNGNFDQNTWYTVVIPIKDLRIENTVITGFVLESGSARTYYIDDMWLVQGLTFPLAGQTAYTAPISSVYDHHRNPVSVSGTTSTYKRDNCADGTVTAYTGEEGSSVYTGKPVPETADTNACNSGVALEGYQKEDRTRFDVTGHYANGEDNVFLFYDGHTGYDYPANNGTPVYATSDGKVTVSQDYSYGGTVVVTHHDGYEAHYLHLTARSVGVGQEVVAGKTQIGTVGSGHLHLTMKLYGEQVDPYGWTGAVPDPARQYVVSVPLWK